MGRRSDIPWDEIKAEYVTTNTSYPKLAKKYHVNLTKVKEHGSAEHWVEERDRYRAEKVQKIQDAMTEEAKKKGLAAIREIGDAAVASIPLIREQIAVAGNGTQAEAAVSALRGLLLIVRDCYGLLTATEMARVEIDRAKLALEREKSQRHDPAENADRIIIGSEVYGE